MNQPAFPVTELNQVRRMPTRGSYDHETVFSIIDAVPFAHIAIPASEIQPANSANQDFRSKDRETAARVQSQNFGVVIIPMMHVRRGSVLYFHGAQTSRMMRYMASGQPITASFAVADGLVLAKSMFHHSMNYRSALIFGRGKELSDDQSRLDALHWFADKLMPGRWQDARQPNAQELKATKIVAVEIETASAKVRTGGPKEDAEDESLPIWSGVIPWSTAWGDPEPDPLSQHLPLPDYLTKPKS